MGEEFTPEEGDTVEFLTITDFGEYSGRGTIVKAHKNGAIVVDMDGKKYKSNNYFILSKTG